MRLAIRALALLLPASLALAGSDPLKSAQCAQALAVLEAARQASPRQAGQVETLRQQAAGACLGNGGADQPLAPASAAAPAIRPLRQPLHLPSPATASPRPPPAAAPTAPAYEPPPVITSCDAGGCWDSRGTRLNRAGPDLLGPGGLCTQQGQTVRCP